MRPRAVIFTRRYESSIAGLERIMLQEALQSESMGFPNGEDDAYTQAWDQLQEVEKQAKAIRPDNDPRLKLLSKISRDENYYVFHLPLNPFRIFFVLNPGMNALQALFIRRSHSAQGNDLLSLLEGALRDVREEF